MKPSRYKQQILLPRKRRAYQELFVLLLVLTGLISSISSVQVYARETTTETNKQVPFEEIMKHLSLCESSNNPQAINSKELHGKSYGLYQFRLDTFQHFGKRYGLPHDDIFNPAQQHDIVKKMIEEGRWQHWFNCLEIYFE